MLYVHEYVRVVRVMKILLNIMNLMPSATLSLETGKSVSHSRLLLRIYYLAINSKESFNLTLPIACQQAQVQH